ncbi:MAG TPA: hypothetical protein DCR27_08980 [Lachnospiraceae bacterium]|nr:hypothetical protein [Lachnospiraceae bacterium]
MIITINPKKYYWKGIYLRMIQNSTKNKFLTVSFWKWSSFLWLILLLLSLIPILLLEKYNFPSADDFGYSALTRHAWLETHNIASVFAAAFYKVADIYQNWQGTWSSVFLMTLQPGIFGDRFYWITTWIMVGAISFSGFYLFHTIFCTCLRADKHSWLAVSSLYLLLGIQCMVDKTQGLFWYNGAVHYILPQSALFILTACILKMSVESGNPIKVFLITIFLSCYIGGGNYITGLECGILLFTAIALCFFGKKKKNFYRLLFPTVIWAVSFFINIISPGNLQRQKEFINHPGIIRSILRSFYYCLDFVWNQWINWTTLLFVLLLLPFLLKAVRQYKGTFSFSYPLLVPVYSFCILSSMFTPSVFAEGLPGTGRIYNIIYLTWLLFIVVNILYLYGWYLRKYGSAWKLDENDAATFHIFSAMVAFCCFAFTSIAEPDFFTSTSALRSLLNGEAKGYRIQQEERLKILTDDTIQDAKVKEFTNKPYLLFYSDVDASADSWWNIRASKYYKKNRISLIKPDK